MLPKPVCVSDVSGLKIIRVSSFNIRVIAPEQLLNQGEFLKLISVHVPKAGGSSLAMALAKGLGSAFQAEYNDDPVNPACERNINPRRYFSRKRKLPSGISCLHGHFHPGQFDLADSLLFTLLRHPVDNIISIYFFWKKLPSVGQALHDSFLQHRMSIIEMAQLPLLRHLYSRTYFGEFDMGRFDLIGRHEDRAAALTQLSQILGVELDVSIKENVTAPDDDREALLEDRTVMQKLHNILAEDIRFYERVAA